MSVEALVIAFIPVFVTAVGVLSILAKGWVDSRLKRQDALLAAVHHEVKPNSGASMADAVNRTETATHRTETETRLQTQLLEQVCRRLDAQRGDLNEFRTEFATHLRACPPTEEP